MSDTITAIALAIESSLIAFLLVRNFQLRLDLDIAQSKAKIAQSFSNSQSAIADMLKQAEQLAKAKPVYDDRTKSLIALALDPHANPNEARNAALQACKRIQKMR